MANKYIVPVGILAATIFIIVGGYIILNPQQPDTSSTLNDSYIEPIEEEYRDFMPKIKVTEDTLKQNAKIPFKVGNRYQYKTTTQYTHKHVECKDEASQREYNRRMKEYHKKILEGHNITEPELPAGCEQKNKTISTTIVIEYNVERTEKAEGKECYVVNAKEEHDIEEIRRVIRGYMPTAGEEEIERMARQQKAMMEKNTAFYYDKETGRIMKIVTKMGETKMTFTKDYCNFIESLGGMMGMLVAHPPLGRWMLALNENFRWTQTIDVEEAGQKQTTEIEYNVVGTEKVNNIECFKVEITMKDKSKEPMAHIPIKSKMNVWVSKEKRILVRAQTEVENLMTTETNLISEM